MRIMVSVIVYEWTNIEILNIDLFLNKMQMKELF